MPMRQPALDGSKGSIFDGRDRVERITLGRRSWLSQAVSSMKALASVTFTRTTSWTFGGGRGSTSLSGGIDYRERAGDGRGNAIVFSAIDLLSTTFAQSPMQVKQIVGDQQNIIATHEITRRLVKPNDFYSGKLLWKATIIDHAFGNAYWLKVRSGAGKPVQFFWVPSTMMEPKWPQDDPTVFISHYEYNPNGKPLRIPVEDVVHFRNGMDPRNIRKGLSPLGALMREIATDEEAAEMQNTVLRNLGVAGMVISPKSDKGRISDADANKIKAQVMMRTTGDRRGEPLVVGGAVEVAQMGTDFGKLDLAGWRHIPEERITSVFGTPAVLLGLGTGLENATFSNVDGLRRIFYENKVIPLQGFIAADLHTQLVPDFEANADAFVLEFDNSDVRVLKEDENQSVERWLKELESGGMTLNEYRALRNREPVDDDMYMLNSRIIPVSVEDMKKKATVHDEPVVTDTGNASAGAGNSNAGGASGGSNGSSGNAAGGSANSGDKGTVPAVHTKDVGDSIQRIRTRLHGQCAKDVQAYLDGQRSFVLAQIDAQSEKIRVNWNRVQEDLDAIKSVLEPWYKRALVAVHDVVQDVLDTRYELSSTDERTYLKAAALNLKGINETTRAAVAAAIALSVELDETPEELKERIMLLGAFSEERATLIATTELATSTNLAQIESYRASDVVVGVRITDGDSDKVCANLNGTKVKISEARSIPPLGHPNCVRRFWHIIDASEMASSEAA